MVHLILNRSLQRVAQQLGKVVEQRGDIEGPVQDQCLGLGVHFGQDVENPLQGGKWEVTFPGDPEK